MANHHYYNLSMKEVKLSHFLNTLKSNCNEIGPQLSNPSSTVDGNSSRLLY